MPPKRKTQKPAPKQKVQKTGGIFKNLAFYYPKDAPGFKEIKAQINDNDGVVTSSIDTAEFYLIPSGSAKEYPAVEDVLVDVSFVIESIRAGKLLDRENYIVSYLLPVPAAWQERGEGKILAGNQRSSSRSPKRPDSAIRSTSAPKKTITQSQTPSPTRRPATSTVSPFARRTLAWPRVGIDRKQDPIPSRGRELYSHDDDMLLVRYVLNNSSRGSANGNILWERAERENVVDGRTWQSMQGRYKKHLRDKWPALLKDYDEWSRK